MDLQRVVSEQAAIIEKLRAENAALKAENAALKKNSSTSSKPPSSDIVKPKPPKTPKDKKKRKRGAQPGHQQHLREPLPPEMIDEILKIDLSACPSCNSKLKLIDGETKTFQQIELVEKPIVVRW